MNKLTDNQKRFFNSLQVGQTLPGKVKLFKNYGAFVSLGPVDGLIATKDITWGRISDPEDFLKLYQKVAVKILSIDAEKYNIALGIKQTQPHPWDVAKTKYKEGDTVVGQVVEVQPYGAFLQIFPGFEGLIHVKEISDDKKITDAKIFFKTDESYEAKIISLDFENKKMGLSIK